MTPDVYFSKFLVRPFIFRKSKQNKYKKISCSVLTAREEMLKDTGLRGSTTLQHYIWQLGMIAAHVSAERYLPTRQHIRAAISFTRLSACPWVQNYTCVRARWV
jgi:hypothetical protein